MNVLRKGAPLQLMYVKTKISFIKQASMLDGSVSPHEYGQEGHYGQWSPVPGNVPIRSKQANKIQNFSPE